MSRFLHAWRLRAAFRRILGDEPPREAGELTADAKRLLHAMSLFCHANESCVVVGKDGHVDTHATLLAEGRREVFIEMRRAMNVTDEELFALRDPDEDLTHD